jgi:tetratricopeptide (TPR) repeat protein
MGRTGPAVGVFACIAAACLFLTPAVCRPEHPAEAQANYEEGVACVRRGDMDGAIKEFRLAVKLAPDFAEARNALGVALGRKGDLDGSIAELQEALRLRPSYSEAYYNLGLDLVSKRDWDPPSSSFVSHCSSIPNFTRPITISALLFGGRAISKVL